MCRGCPTTSSRWEHDWKTMGPQRGWRRSFISNKVDFFGDIFSSFKTRRPGDWVRYEITYAYFLAYYRTVRKYGGVFSVPHRRLF